VQKAGQRLDQPKTLHFVVQLIKLCWFGWSPIVLQIIHIMVTWLVTCNYDDLFFFLFQPVIKYLDHLCTCCFLIIWILSFLQKPFWPNLSQRLISKWAHKMVSNAIIIKREFKKVKSMKCKVWLKLSDLKRVSHLLLQSHNNSKKKKKRMMMMMMMKINKWKRWFFKIWLFWNRKYNHQQMNKLTMKSALVNLLL